MFLGFLGSCDSEWRLSDQFQGGQHLPLLVFIQGPQEASSCGQSYQVVRAGSDQQWPWPVKGPASSASAVACGESGGQSRECLCRAPRAALTKCCKLGGLEPQKLVVSQFWRLDV